MQASLLRVVQGDLLIHTRAITNDLETVGYISYVDVFIKSEGGTLFQWPTDQTIDLIFHSEHRGTIPEKVSHNQPLQGGYLYCHSGSTTGNERWWLIDHFQWRPFYKRRREMWKQN
jgi:hypothetical protein